MMLKAILCVQHFCSFRAMLFIVNLLMETDFTVICAPCMLKHVRHEQFSYKTCSFGKISSVNQLNFFVLSEIHASKTQFKQINENPRPNTSAHML